MAADLRRPCSNVYNWIVHHARDQYQRICSRGISSSSSNNKRLARGDIRIFNNKNGLLKSQLILEASSADPFHEGEDMAYKDAYLVRRLRNYFIHHYPERIDTRSEEPVTNLGGALKTRDFDIDLVWLDEDSIYFPSKCLGFGLARWCIEAIVEYVGAFEDRLGVENPSLGDYDIYMADLDDVK